MIEQLFAKNFGCLTEVATPKLGMLHAFIGPNDSGKSTLLRAIRLLSYLAPTSFLLVEEPENGLHPARIAEVVTSLRAFSETGTQVVLATHSPLVINELTGDEVSVVTRDDAGMHVTLIKDTPNFEERSKIYALGELWVSYANGKDEAPLLSAPAKK
jgi:predicted ATPase